MIIENVIPRPDIDRVLDVLSTLTWKPGFSRDEGYSQEIKRNQELRQSDDVRLKVVLDALQKKIWSNTAFSIRAFPFKAARLRLNRCADGGFYGPHADASIMNVPPIRSDLSMTLWLTEDYEGGELVVEGERYKGKPGDIIVYPSYSVHEVTPVTQGERICAVMWIQSMIRDQQKRDLMTRFYEYGARLKEKESLSPDYIEITSIYNNLLRLWAET